MPPSSPPSRRRRSIPLPSGIHRSQQGLSGTQYNSSDRTQEINQQPTDCRQSKSPNRNRTNLSGQGQQGQRQGQQQGQRQGQRQGQPYPRRGSWQSAQTFTPYAAPYATAASSRYETARSTAHAATSRSPSPQGSASSSRPRSPNTTTAAPRIPQSRTSDLHHLSRSVPHPHPQHDQQLHDTRRPPLHSHRGTGSTHSSDSTGTYATQISTRSSGLSARNLLAKRRSEIMGESHNTRPKSGPSRAAFSNDRSPPVVFDVFFDLPHPGASKDSERARMIEPPEISNHQLLAELYEASSISRLARFAFPDHDDHKHALDLQARVAGQPARARRQQGYFTEMSGHLNEHDVYLLGFRSGRHTFAIELSDGVTKLYCHTLRYLPHHQHSKSRSDVGRRGVRALVIMTRAAGGDSFYTALLRLIESAMILGDAQNPVGSMEDFARDRAMKVLHGIQRQQAKIFSETMIKLQKGKSSDLDDDFITLSGIEYSVRPGGYIQDRALPGDFIKLQLPQSLQAGFRLGINPDDTDAPVLPLLRALGAGNTIRVISALMCERRIIFVSDDVTKLSICVRAASSLLAQGSLSWKFNIVTVLPPHLLSLLAEPEPYVVGLIDDFLKDVVLLQSLVDVLCIHLDKNQFKTFGMTSPAASIPDILTKSGKETVAHILYNDLQQVLRAEARVWTDGKEEAKPKESGKEVSLANEATPAKRKKRGKGPAIETDMAALFGRVMRGDALISNPDDFDDIVDSSDHLRLDEASGHVPRTNAGESSSSHGDLPSIDTFDVCENVRGEEGLRAALTFFFLVTHGDIGALLSEGTTGFLLDRKKYLLHKKKQGNAETGPLFTLYKTFSGTAMLEDHLTKRLVEFERGKSLLMPRHRSLFALCEKHLRTMKLDFSYVNIRTVVSKTTVHSPLHELVERSELARARALTLTSAQPFDGNVSQALSTMIQDCHIGDSSLPQSMAVIWSRLDSKKSSSWKHPLLGLHLLKNLLLHGPLSVASYALDGIDGIRSLRFYEGSKNEEQNKEVRESARVVWELITDGSRLLLRREQVLASRAKLVDTGINQRWGSYLLKKVPFHTDFKQYHTLLRPTQHSQPAFMKQSGSIARGLNELEILRMKLSPLSDAMTTPNNAAAELKRLREMQSSTHSFDGNSRHSNSSATYSSRSSGGRGRPSRPQQRKENAANSQTSQAQGRPRPQIASSQLRNGQTSPKKSMPRMSRAIGAHAQSTQVNRSNQRGEAGSDNGPRMTNGASPTPAQGLPHVGSGGSIPSNGMKGSTWGLHGTTNGRSGNMTNGGRGVGLRNGETRRPMSPHEKLQGPYAGGHESNSRSQHT